MEKQSNNSRAIMNETEYENSPYYHVDRTTSNVDMFLRHLEEYVCGAC